MFLPPHLRKKRPAPVAKPVPGQVKKGKVGNSESGIKQENAPTAQLDERIDGGAVRNEIKSLSEVLQMNVKAEHYDLDKEVGGGRFGRVFAATDTESKATVAIKSLNLEMLAPGEDSLRKKFKTGIQRSTMEKKPWTVWPRWVCREIQALIECGRESREHVVQLLGVCQQPKPGGDGSNQSSNTRPPEEAETSSKVEKAENDFHVANKTTTTEEANSDGVDNGCVSDKVLVQNQVPAESNENQQPAVSGPDEDSQTSKNVFDYYKKTRLFLVMEYVPHELAKVVEALPKPLPESQVKSLMKQLFEALAAVHRAGWVHRDVKMTNILLSESGNLKLVDFGQARPIAQQPDEQDSVEGFGTDGDRPATPGVVSLWYRPPELLLSDGSVRRRAVVDEKGLPISQLRGREMCAIDMWSAGCILGELLQRAPLFCAKTEIEVLKCIAAATAKLPPDSMLSTFGTFSGLKERLERAIAAGPNLEQRFPECGYDPLDVHSNLKRSNITAFNKTGRELLESLFSWDPMQRITAESAIQHEWLTKTFPAPAKFEQKARKRERRNRWQ